MTARRGGAIARHAFALMAVIGYMACSGGARADELYVDYSVTVPVTAVAATVLLGSELLKADLAPAQCKWCDRNADGTDALNSIDRDVRSALRWSSPQTADTASSAMAYGVAPLTAVTLDYFAARKAGRPEQVIPDVLVIAEAAAIAGVLTQVVKFSTGRERPFVHYLPPDAKPGTADPADNNTSFFSGHTAIAFAIATASGTVADLRGYPSAPLIWTAGLAVATTTAYLRIAADKHYLTDVMAGGAVGALVGLATPRLFHHRNGVQVAYGAGGAPGLTITWHSG